MQPLTRKQKVRSRRATLRNLITNSMSWLPGYPAHPEPAVIRDSPYIKWKTVSSSGQLGYDFIFYWNVASARTAQKRIKAEFIGDVPRVRTGGQRWFEATAVIVETLKTVLDSQGDLYSLIFSRFSTRVQRALANLLEANASVREIIQQTVFYRFSCGKPVGITELDWFQANEGFLNWIVPQKAELERQFDVSLVFLISQFIDDAKGASGVRQSKWLQLVCSQGATSTISSNAKKQWSPNTTVSDSLIKLIIEAYLNRLDAPAKTVIQLLDLTLPRNWSEFLQKAANRIEAENRRRVELINQRVFIVYQCVHEEIRPAADAETISAVISETKLEFSKTYLDEVNLDLGYLVKIISELSHDESRFWIQFLKKYMNKPAKFRRHLLFANGQLFKNKRNQQLAVELQRLSKKSPHYDFASCLLSANTGDEKFKQRLFDSSGIKRQTQDKILQLLVALMETDSFKFTENLLALIASVAATNLDHDSCLALVVRLAELGDSCFCTEEIDAAVHFGSIEYAPRILNASSSGQTSLRSHLVRLKNVVVPESVRTLIKSLVANDLCGECERVCLQINILAGLRLAIPDITFEGKSKSWISSYPLEFRGALELLHRSNPDSRNIAEDILGKDLPSKRQLNRLVRGHQRTLRQLALTDFQRVAVFQRIKKLQSWMNYKPRVSLQRVSNLIAKLTRRALLDQSSRFSTLSHQSILGDCGITGHEILGSSFKMNFEIIESILEMKGVGKKLGLKLIFGHLHSQEFAGLPAPENDEFLASMDTFGVNMKPWIGCDFTQDAVGIDGSAYQLAFCREVVDYLMMGDRFNTCLSLHDINFFSTISNAVDINKQVVYGKDSSGRVVGRALFALTDEGRILTFHAYSHEVRYAFRANVVAFAKRLSAEMNTFLVSDGEVAQLVADDWYDDGAMEIEDGDRKSITEWCYEIAEDGGKLAPFEKFMDAEFTEPMTNQFFDTLFRIYGLDVQKDVFGEIISRFRHRETLDFANRLVLAFVCFQRGSTSVAFDLIGTMGNKELLRFFERNRFERFVDGYLCLSHESVVEFLSDYDASLTLKILRVGRTRRKNSDLAVADREMRELLGMVHRKLGRNAFADKLCK